MSGPSPSTGLKDQGKADDAAPIGHNANQPVVWERGKPVYLPVPGGRQGVALAANDENPDPAQAVTWGPLATNEMFDPFVEISYDRQAAPLLDAAKA